MTEVSGALGRTAVGGFLLALVAAVLMAGGGAVLRGALGSLFGFHSQQAVEAIPRALRGAPVAAGPAASQAALARGATRVAAHRRHRDRHAPSQSSPRPAPARPQPAPQGQPPAQPPAPPAPAPAPAPPAPAPPHGVVEQAKSTLQTAAAVLPQPVQPAVGQGVGVVDTVCGLLGGCP